MKKIIIAIAFCLFTILSGCNASTKPTEGLSFSAENGTYIVSSYSGDDVNIVIPDTYNDIPVTAIGEDCFENSDIQSIKLGSNITEIRSGAFYNATMLQKIEIPSSVQYIGEIVESGSNRGTFFNCLNLTKVTFESGSSLTQLGYETFGRCSRLEEIVLPDSITHIGSDAFNGCTALTNIDIPASVTSMGYSVFSQFTENQTIHVLGSTDEWIFTSDIQYNDFYTWNYNCNAEIIYEANNAH